MPIQLNLDVLITVFLAIAVGATIFLVVFRHHSNGNGQSVDIELYPVVVRRAMTVREFEQAVLTRPTVGEYLRQYDREAK